MTIAWDPQTADARSAAGGPAGYLIEAGSAPGASDVAQVMTEGALTRYVTPVPNGVYYVRVKARNDCGHGAPSAERSVRVDGSVPKGPPNPAVLLDTVQGLREHLGATAFVQVTGQVRNGWGAAPATFVEVTASFDGPKGDLSNTAAGFVNGASRRLRHSRLVTDTTLEANATGCFALFAEVPQAQGRVTGLSLTASSATLDTDPVEGLVRAVADAPKVDEFGDLVVPIRAQNAGTRSTMHNEVWTEVTGGDGRVLGCRSTPVRGGVVSPPDGTPTSTSLAPGQTATLDVNTEVEAARARGLVQWVTWDDGIDVAAQTPLLRELRARVIALQGAADTASIRDVARARDAWRRQVLAVELGASKGP